MEDRFTRGFVAGIIGGIAEAAYSYAAGMAGITTMRIVDWIAIFIYAHTPPFSIGELAYATLAQLGLGGVLGVTFAFLLPYVASRNLLFKGWLFSATVWFAMYAITTLFQLMGTVPTPMKTAISHFVGASIFGLVQAYALQALSPQENGSGLRASLAPAMKPLDDVSNEDAPDTNRNPQGG